ncbi:interferon-induced 35 kDa protein [Canis lupus familiaris]|uniref:Interferon induced protein 35 n=2 Tax=Canis lupus familiaris TaxID=9615 RepID=A0A8C0RAJ1_CANLF|nr:interferon-induced 35 kDa protein [Canis lupus familiaris]XP_038532295.1 interferon-induced 35 kDa protein [Canis lupus familiaris]XP_548077.2 interferon-induced 35 kDa protein [Canis lupus familiaris]|eukprot:XP_548077.2 interferon-induced 35 kDa protein [Canis lupus familiaris]
MSVYDVALCALQEEQTRLMRRLQELQQQRRELRDIPPDQVPFSVPALPLVFRGHTQQGKEVPTCLVSKLRICYPLPGGSALVNFDDPKVAERVVQQKEHKIDIEECRLRVQVEALELPMVTTIQVSTQISRWSVLVSGFPAGLRLSEEELLDKLEIFFGKIRNGGGEVETRELLLQGGVVLGFTKDTVAQHLCQVGQFTVPLGRQSFPLRVSPYLSGEIQKAEIMFRPVPQSVLVLNIPDVLDGPELQDILEIHFQKPSRGGGEVESLRVVPPGQRGLAVFTATSG